MVDYLVGKGIGTARLDAQGYGETKPIADNRTRDGRARNRRVVFSIVGTNTVENRQHAADDSTKAAAPPAKSKELRELKKPTKPRDQ